MIVRLWKGWHSSELAVAVNQAWLGSHLLILCPPSLEDFSFLQFIAADRLELLGEWNHVDRARVSSVVLGAKARELPASPVFGLFTTGSVSGAPRLILYSRANVEASLSAIRSLFEVSLLKRIFCYPQPTHTFGLTLGYLQAMLYDLPLFTPKGRYSRSAHQSWIETEKEGLLTLGTPVHFLDLLRWMSQQGAEVLPSYSCIIGGAKVSVELWRRVRDELKIERPSVGYGATEASPGLAHLPPGEEPKEDGDVGFFLPGVTAANRPGEGVLFGGTNACMAMVHGDEIEFPEKILIRDELHTRGLDGRLVFKGRTDFMINRGGAKFSLEAVEEKIKSAFQLPAACVAVPCARLGQDFGVVVEAANAPPNTEIVHLFKHHFGVGLDPRNIMAVKRLPLNLNSKIDRRRCLELLRREANDQNL